MYVDVRFRTSPHMQIICKYSFNMTEDVDDVVMASQSFFVLCDSDEEENDERQRRFWVHGVNGRRDVYDQFILSTRNLSQNVL